MYGAWASAWQEEHWVKEIQCIVYTAESRINDWYDDKAPFLAGSAHPSVPFRYQKLQNPMNAPARFSLLVASSISLLICSDTLSGCGP